MRRRAVVRTVGEMTSQVTLDRLRAEGFEAWATGRWPQGRQELADLCASAVDGGFMELAILTQMVEVGLQQPTDRCPVGLGLGWAVNVNVGQVGTEPLEGAGGGRSRRVVGGGTGVLGVDIQEGLDQARGRVAWRG